MSQHRWSGPLKRVALAVAFVAIALGVTPLVPASPSAPVCSMACCRKAKACCCASASHESARADRAGGDSLERPSLVQACFESCAQAPAPASNGDRLATPPLARAVDAHPPQRSPTERFVPRGTDTLRSSGPRAPPTDLS